jgi:uncharacterized protein YndB with AHSA1/START domain
MPLTRVSRTVAAPPQAVWDVVADPYHQARWWPRVRRIEAVDEGGWTQVLATAKGKGVRADFRLTTIEPPRLVRWAQELAGTPFERILAAAETTILLVPADGEPAATVVTIELRQRLRGWSRFGPFLFRAAARRQLGEALDGLALLLERRG